MIPLVLALAGVLSVAAGYAIAGPAGVVVVAVLCSVLVGLAVRLSIREPSATQAGTDRIGRVNAAFSAYLRIENALSEGPVSGRRFDLVTRPVLTRLFEALLADRRRVDLRRDPGAASQAIGEDLWPLLDPARPPADPAAPGVTLAALTTIADRLEEL